MHTKKTAIIVQARLGSTRLPGKVLRQIGGKTVLAHIVERLKAVKSADCVVIATTDKESDTPVAEAAAALGAIVFRGDEADVLSRYQGAARAIDADIIMRVTSDCPLIDPEICEAVLRLRAETNADYAASNMPRLFPHGLDCETFTRSVLERAAILADEPYDREHVTPWIRRAPDLRHVNVTGPGWPANQHRWTLDYPEDLTFFANLFEKLPRDRIPPWQEVLSLISQEPALVRANAMHRAANIMSDDLAAPVAVFHFEANAEIGSGHAMRSNTLQSQLEAMGWRCHWAVDHKTEAFLQTSIPPAAVIRLTSSVPQEAANQIADTIGKCDILFIDHYGTSRDFASAARGFARRVVYFDDLANREIDADIVLNPTPGFTADQYVPLNRRPARYLLGHDYALLRQQFSAKRAARLRALAQPPANEPPQRVLVAFGGVDPLNGTGLTLDVLSTRPGFAVDIVLGSSAPHLNSVKQQVAASKGRFNLLTDIADMAGLMAASEIVIGAPGSSTWERGCLGLASLLVGIAENQRPNAAMVEEVGAGMVVGFLTSDTREQVAADLAKGLDKLLGDPVLRHAMSRAAADLWDGRGAQRVVAALQQDIPIGGARSLRLRPVEFRDEALLLDWQTAPETRRFAFRSEVPTAEEHHTWLTAKLASDRDWLLIGEVDGVATGYVRLDWLGEDKGRPQYLISIATAPDQYRQGIGSAMLRGTRALAPGAHFYAKVMAENIASLALFRKAGYSLVNGYFHSLPAQREES